MKITEKPKANKKQKTKKKPISKPKKEHVLIVAQEIKFARLLAGNEKKTRDRALKTLKKWLLNCFQKGYEFKEDDFLRIWKGLFYAVWMSDKPLVQEELCESIAGILDLFPGEQLKHALLMVRVGLQVLATEWYGIDHHRMDKCLMLVRRYLRGSLRCLQRCGWTLDSCHMYSKMMTEKDGILSSKTPLYARNATSMILHIIDCFLEELAKVSQGEIPEESVAELLRPFCQYICSGEVPTLCTASRRVVTALVRQSDLGLQYQDATRAWEKMGCPEGGPEALELVSDDDEQNDDDEPDDDDDDDTGSALDPRAGRVDVSLATLPVPSAQLAASLRDMITKCASKAHKRARICLQRLEKLAADEYPLRIKTPPVIPSSPGAKPGKAAKSLRAIEKQLVAASDELALRGLSRKHRKRLLAKSRAGLSIVEDVASHSAVSDINKNGNWKVEECEPTTKKQKQDTSNKENVAKNKKDKKRSIEKQNGERRKRKLEEKTDDIPEKKEKLDKKKDGEKKLKIKKNSIENTETKVKDKLPKRNKNTPVIIEEKTKIKNNPVTIEEKTKIKKTPIIKEKSKRIALQSVKKDTKKSETKNPTLTVNKIKNFQKQLSPKTEKIHATPKKVKFVLKNNSMQGTVDYYKSIRQSPNIPFDSSKQPSKTNLKPSTPSPINPWFKKKLRMKH